MIISDRDSLPRIAKRPRAWHAAAAVLAGAALLAQAGSAVAEPQAPLQLAQYAQAALGAAQEFYVVTVHIDGNTTVKGDASHPAEAFPTMALPGGGGLQLTKPDEAGAWRVRSFVFHPAQIIVRQGDRVTLHFVGVQGPSHRIKVDGVAEEIKLARGEIKSASLVADKVGTIDYMSLDRLPSMRGQIVVLPR